MAKSHSHGALNSVEAAQQQWYTTLQQYSAFDILEPETIPLHKANGRVTARPIWARISSPHYHAAAMDGYAVRAATTQPLADGGVESVALRVDIDAIAVNTGEPLPAGMDAVVMVEYTDLAPSDPTMVTITQAVTPWKHVRSVGEDMVQGQLVLPAHHQLRPQDLGAIAGCGHGSVEVIRRPRVAIIPTGSELVQPGESVQAGSIIEYNSLVLGAQIEALGAVVTRFPSIPDEYETIKQTVSDALQRHDLVLINAGSSAGSKDYTAAVMAELGEICVKGVAMRPGHPVILGIAALDDDYTNRTQAVVGVPGYPVAAAVTCDVFVKPLLQRWQAYTTAVQPHAKTISAALTTDVSSPTHSDEFLRVALASVGGQTLAMPLSRGSGIIMSLVQADGFVTVPQACEGYPAGQTVSVDLLTNNPPIEQTIILAGEDEPTLDHLYTHLHQIHDNTPRPYRLHHQPMSHEAALRTLEQGKIHMAGIVSDTPDAPLDISPDKYAIIPFCHRQVGLIVQSGNPKNLTHLSDLIRNDVSFVNHVPDSHTRHQLDRRLTQLKIDSTQIQGYGRAERHHRAVAAAVQSGVADCGVGVSVAAHDLNLDFVSLWTEMYWLVINQEVVPNDLFVLLQGYKNSLRNH
ncbi:MAG: molybdopterin biosynthesis protein [Chloroflexota bacterium]